MRPKAIPEHIHNAFRIAGNTRVISSLACSRRHGALRQTKTRRLCPGRRARKRNVSEPIDLLIKQVKQKKRSTKLKRARNVTCKRDYKTGTLHGITVLQST